MQRFDAPKWWYLIIDIRTFGIINKCKRHIKIIVTSIYSIWCNSTYVMVLRRIYWWLDGECRTFFALWYSRKFENFRVDTNGYPVMCISAHIVCTVKHRLCDVKRLSLRKHYKLVYKMHCQRFNTGVFYAPAKILSFKKNLSLKSIEYLWEKRYILLHFIIFFFFLIGGHSFVLKYESETHEFWEIIKSLVFFIKKKEKLLRWEKVWHLWDIDLILRTHWVYFYSIVLLCNSCLKSNVEVVHPSQVVMKR